MRQVLVVAMCCSLALFASAAWAGRLGGFEQDVTTPSFGGGSSVTPGENASGEDCSPLFQDCTTDEGPAVASKVELFPRKDTYTQLALRYHYAFLGVSSYDVQVDKVFGKYGVSAKYDYYTEKNASNTLGVAGVYMLYRPAASKQFQVDVGFGFGGLFGSQSNTGLSLELPMKLRLSEHSAFRITPAVTYLANQMVEMDGALEIHGANTIYSIGYRSLRGPTQRLEGPYLGFAYRW